MDLLDCTQNQSYGKRYLIILFWAVCNLFVTAETSVTSVFLDINNSYCLFCSFLNNWEFNCFCSDQMCSHYGTFVLRNICCSTFNMALLLPPATWRLKNICCLHQPTARIYDLLHTHQYHHESSHELHFWSPKFRYIYFLPHTRELILLPT